MQSNKVELEDARICRLFIYRDILFVYGNGVVLSSSDGENWKRTISQKDHTVARDSEIWCVNDSCYYSLTYPGTNVMYFRTHDGFEWDSMTADYIPKYNFRFFPEGRFVVDGQYRVIGDVGEPNVKSGDTYFMPFLLENYDSDSLFAALFSIGARDSMWSRVMEVPWLAQSFSYEADTVRNMDRLMMCDYFESEDVVVVYIDSLGLYYSRDNGDTWQMAFVGSVKLPRLVDFGEWKGYLVFLDENRRFGKIPIKTLLP